jgi:hypothetical protein
MCSRAAFDATLEQQNLVLSHFFAESNIVHTLQHLLSNTPQDVEDLCKLCVAASEDSVVMALNMQGLMPFANHPEFVYPYSCMSMQQLRALKGHCVSAHPGIACQYDNDAFLLSIFPEAMSLDKGLLLFAGACILLRGLSQTNTTSRGVSYSFLSQTPELLRHHANVFFFQIVNAGSFRQSAVRDAARLLEKHNVHV